MRDAFVKGVVAMRKDKAKLKVMMNENGSVKIISTW